MEVRRCSRESRELARVKEICFVGTELPSIGDVLHGVIRLKQSKIDILNCCDGLVLGNNSYNYFIPVRVAGSQLTDQPGIGSGGLDYFPHSEVAAGLVQRVEA